MDRVNPAVNFIHPNIVVNVNINVGHAPQQQQHPHYLIQQQQRHWPPNDPDATEYEGDLSDPETIPASSFGPHGNDCGCDSDVMDGDGDPMDIDGGWAGDDELSEEDAGYDTAGEYMAPYDEHGEHDEYDDEEEQYYGDDEGGYDDDEEYYDCEEYYNSEEEEEDQDQDQNQEAESEAGDQPARQEESLFHNILPYIEKHPPSNITPPPFVTCPICQTTQLSIRGLPPLPHPLAQALSLPQLAPGVVLICGHMVCAPCWHAYEDQHYQAAVGASIAEATAAFAAASSAFVDHMIITEGNNNGEEDEEVVVVEDDDDDDDDDESDDETLPPPRCPVCRLVLCHAECGCEIPPLRLPRHPDEAAWLVAAQEGGGANGGSVGWGGRAPRRKWYSDYEEEEREAAEAEARRQWPMTVAGGKEIDEVCRTCRGEMGSGSPVWNRADWW